MCWFLKKRKQNKIDEIKDDINMLFMLGTLTVCIPIPFNVIDEIRDWCEKKGYHIEVDHIDDNDIYYRIKSGVHNDGN